MSGPDGQCGTVLYSTLLMFHVFRSMTKDSASISHYLLDRKNHVLCLGSSKQRNDLTRASKRKASVIIDLLLLHRIAYFMMARICFFVSLSVWVPSILWFYLQVGVVRGFAPNNFHRNSNLALCPAISIGKCHSVSTTVYFQSVPPRGGPSPSTTSLASATILPFVYTGFSMGLLYKAANVSTQPAEKIIVVAAALLALLNFGPSDNAKLTSAKRACKQTKPASAGKEKQTRQAALTWRKAVRVKILGQIAGLTRILLAKEAVGVMRGAALVMGAVMMYLISGGGRANHDSDGNWKPLPEKSVTTILMMDAVFFGAALFAAERLGTTGTFTQGSFVAVMIYAFGAIGGSLEGLPQFLKAIQGNKQ